MAKHEPESDVITSEDVGTVESVLPEQPTEDQLKAELQTALDSGDFKAVAQVSRKIDTMQRTAEKSELDAKRAKQTEVVGIVAGIYANVKDSIITELENHGVLDITDGIWISDDFGEQAPTVRVMRTATRTAKAGGGGTGKKFDVHTSDLLLKFGEQAYKDSGMNFNQAYQSNTDKNWRFAIRNALLKLDGII